MLRTFGRCQVTSVFFNVDNPARGGYNFPMAIAGMSILERMIDADNGDFTPEVARYFLSLDFSPQEHARCETLSGKAAEGTLSEDEAGELDEFLVANALLGVLQSKARISIRRRTPAA
jgi:hypothetical protein